VSLRVAAVLALGLLLAACSRGEEPQGQPPAVPVRVATAVQKSVPIQDSAVGTVQPSRTVTVRSRVEGTLLGIHFTEGDDVREGQRLFTLDRAPLETALRQAEANAARSRTQLENARRDAARYADLARQGFVAQQEYDRLRTEAQALEATARADQAVVENARIQLGWATITAPMAGRTGALLVHEGDLVKASDTNLVVINQLRPIEVAFALPESALGEVRASTSRGALTVSAATAQGQHLADGTLTFVDNRVDPETGTIQLKALFENADGALWPGQYVQAVLTLGVQADAVVVPTTAVQTGQQGPYVFVVKPDRTVESRPVVVARAVGSETAIAKGVAVGETVVTEGQLRLVPGARVEVPAAAAAGATVPASAAGAAGTAGPPRP
jgi:multidrug efflux system membrane fusion protein